jgi:hypothetical protein
MPTFALKPIEEVTGRLTFYRLYVDGTCEWEEFWNAYANDPQYATELEAIQRRMELLAELRPVNSPSKWKELKRNKSDPYKDYEIKTKHLRAYYFKVDEGNAVVLIGFKKDQDKDINRLRRIKQAYFMHVQEAQRPNTRNSTKPKR